MRLAGVERGSAMETPSVWMRSKDSVSGKCCTGRMGKHAQLTVFIIVGLVVLGAVLSVLFVNARIAEADPLASLPPEVRLAAVAGELQTFVSDCVEQVSVPLVERMMSLGGSLDPKSDVYHDRTALTVYCSKASGRDCVSTAPFREEMQDELARGIDIALEGCLDFSGFSRRGYGVSAPERAVSVVVGEDDVYVSLEMPAVVTVGDRSSTSSKFQGRIPLPLGRLYALAVDIANREILDGFFDKDEWMVSHGSEVLLERHRPYPDVVYILRKRVSALGREFDAVFRFGIEGRETFNLESQSFGQSQPCFTGAVDGLCYQNVPVSRSKLFAGNVSVGCICPVAVKPRVEGCCVASDGSCSFSDARGCVGRFVEGDVLCQQSGCPNLQCQRPESFRNEPKRHLESWCTYDGLVTRGQDYVGSRHTLHTCIDGKDVVEECRDYREELCTEESRDRDGERYSKAVCRTNRWYDCASQGVETCEDRRVRDCSWFGGLWSSRKCHPAVAPGFRFWAGENAAVCSVANEAGLGKPLYRSFGHSAALYCQRMGDCGHYRNIADVVTKLGWSHPLDTSRLRSFVYQPAGLTARGKDFILDVGVDNVFFDQGVQPPVAVRGGSIRCFPWRAPWGNEDCSLCAAEPGKPCTEYRCRSLGQQCVFSMDKGEGVCAAAPAVSERTLVVSSGGLDEGVTVAEDDDRFCPGVKTSRLVPPVRSDVPVSFGVSVSEASKCVVSVIPSCLGIDPAELVGADVLGPGSLPDIAMSDGDVRASHQVSIIFPSPAVSKFDSLQLYVNCVSPEGRVNRDTFSYRFDVVEGADAQGPVVLQVVPDVVLRGESVPVALYASERISECRYAFVREDYDVMANASCPASDITDVNYVPGAPLGSYPCEFNVTAPVEAEVLFVQCKDVSGLRGEVRQVNVTGGGT